MAATTRREFFTLAVGTVGCFTLKSPLAEAVPNPFDLVAATDRKNES